VKHRSTFRKKDYPVSEIRRYLEPGPVVLVSSAWKENTNIITMGWHMVLEFSPSLVACCISSTNHSFEMIRRSQECVINVPATDLVKQGDRHRRLLWRGDGQIQSVRARARTILLRGRILTSNSASISSTGSSSAGGGAQKGSPLAYKITRICLIPLIASCNLNRTSMF
jgi:hypothetical protein